MRPSSSDREPSNFPWIFVLWIIFSMSFYDDVEISWSHRSYSTSGSSFSHCLEHTIRNSFRKIDIDTLIWLIYICVNPYSRCLCSEITEMSSTPPHKPSPLVRRHYVRARLASNPSTLQVLPSTIIVRCCRRFPDTGLRKTKGSR